MARSLRTRLLTWVMVPLAGAVAIDAWISHGNASDTAAVVQDRLLLGSARIVAEQLRFEDGSFQEQIPPAALEIFQSSDVDRIYYRVTAGSGQLVTGYSELPLPSKALQSEVPYFFDATVRGAPVRAVAYQQPIISERGVAPVLVEFAQTMHGHAELTRGLWLHTVLQQLAILALATVLIVFGLRRGLQPLLSLRDVVQARELGTLEPLESTAIPVELAPLVVAINEYVRRLEVHTSAQRIFIQDAAHQLRTPFTLLNTQVSFAIRAADPVSRAESLAAIRQTVQQAVRLINQLLTLSAAEADVADEAAHVAVGIDVIVQQVLEDLAAHAQVKSIDLGFEMHGTAPTVAGHPVALREIVMNLVDNAIRYTQSSGVVTARISVANDCVELVVEDNGPGIPVEYRERVFERFYRINDRDWGGCGLGLPIVREFASRVGATVSLHSPAAGKGLAVAVRFTPYSSSSSSERTGASQVSKNE